jgi:GR25 family glycosyltransferase involved in LPS biosynthesis
MTSFFENYPLYYINLLDRKDRDTLFVKQMNDLGIKNYQKIVASEVKDIDEEILEMFGLYGCTKLEAATVASHLNAIKYFLDNSEDEYAIICEDDADLTNSKNINFTLFELFAYSNGVECFQLAVSTREDIQTNHMMHKITPWDFNASTYAISRKYAEKIIKKYFNNNKLSLDNFESIDIFDYRNSSVIKSIPVAEYIVYERNSTITCPIFSFIISESSIQHNSEHLRQNIKSKHDFIKHWSRFEKIEYQDIIDTNANYFSSSVLDTVPINKKVSVVIPWRPTESRISLLDFLIKWYSKEFPNFNIILSDSDHEQFNLSASRNVGISQAFAEGADIILSSDADFFPSKDSVIKAILNSSKTNNISVPYNDCRELTYEGTLEFLKENTESINMYDRRNDNPKLIDGKADRLWMCSGLVVITKKVFEEIGNFDENYVGWGQEDIDYHQRYLDKYGKLFDYIDGTALSLSHSRDNWKLQNNNNIDYFKSKHGDKYIF